MFANVYPLPVRYLDKRISIVMVTYHTGPSLLESLRAVLSDPDIYEIILVDNGNSAAARQRMWALAGKHQHLRIIQGQGNIGFGRACNYGALMARGDYILFLNPDAVITKGAAMKMAECGQKLQAPWITGGLLETQTGVEQRGARRKELTPISAVITFTGLYKFPGVQSIHLEKTPRPDKPIHMPVVSGACMMMDRVSFDILGGFDERYFLHVEDIDICRRARLAGGEVFFVPSAKVMHYGSSSMVRIQKVEYEKFKGFVRYFWNYSSRFFAKVLLVFAVPCMFFAIMGRAWWLALRATWRDEPREEE
ncbi:MAG: glycosyl transferase [Robiginitomaculum sp.]|nr:MAG: glycosyl transferase [Robiginitomaculum sp.]